MPVLDQRNCSTVVLKIAIEATTVEQFRRSSPEGVGCPYHIMTFDFDPPALPFIP
jgi:hypothetical protein